MSFELNQDAFDYIFTSMDDAICVITGEGVLKYANFSAQRLFGINGEDQNGEKLWKYVPYTQRNDDLIQMFIESCKQKLISHQAYVDYENKEGKVFKLRVCMSAIRGKGGEVLYISIISDLTEFIRVNTAFQRYTSSEIADFVLNDPKGEMLGGQQRDCSILMSDLRGFTALSTRMTPADLITVLNHYFEAMVEIIERNGGTVIEFLGDGIFVVFGAPKEEEEHALLSVCCAVEMQNAMEEVNRWNEENNFPALEMGIGINSGQVVVGNIGSQKKAKYGCMGENVNLAGRVESYTIGGQIYISENTRKRISEELDIAGEDSFLPKGGKEELKIYDIRGAGQIKINSLNEDIRWESITRKPEVIFYKLEGKAVIDEKNKGFIKALSLDGRYGLLETTTELLDKQNIMIDIGGDLYAKVVGTVDGRYKICFTAKPDIFTEWLSKFTDNSGLKG